MSRKRIHLVCNAHLDPVWLWSWEDGLAEAISTFRIAAEFCEQHAGFVFNHNEALLYHWVERHDPELFERIRRLVAAGHWHVAGGAWLQPDVNAPHGESLIRQFLMGLAYFGEKLGARPTTAYNFDPFGHPAGLPQILAGCGMDSYIFCRPDYGVVDLPLGVFEWRDRSGASVLARRSDDMYLTRGNLGPKLERFVEHYAAEPVSMILWGVGNHGGAVTRDEYAVLKAFATEHPEIELIESTPEEFFAEARKRVTAPPTVDGEIERCFAGCYTSMGRLKRAHRETEGLMATTERLCALAWWLGEIEYPRKDLEVAWRDILFAEFHDVLPGSGIMQVERDALQVLAHAREKLRRVRHAVLLRGLRGEQRAAEGEVPLYVVNPHGFRLRALVELDYVLSHDAIPGPRIELRSGGRKVPCQRIKAENNLAEDWAVRVAVPLDLKPFEMRRLDARAEPAGVEPPAPQRRKVSATDLNLAGKGFELSISPRTGFVERLQLAAGEDSLVRRGAFAPVLYADIDHSWTCGDPAQMDSHAAWAGAPQWKAPTERFRLARPEEAAALSPLPGDRWSRGARLQARGLRLVEDGPVVKVVEALFVCGPSAVVRHYVVAPQLGWFEIRDRIFFNHRDHMLKLEVPLGFAPQRGICEAAYSASEHAPTARCEEHPNQRWVAVVGADGATLAVASTGSFGHHLTRRALGLNALRSPAYSSFSIAPGSPWSDGRFLPRQDQGEHELRWAVQVSGRFDERATGELAEVLNVPPWSQVHYSPGGEGRGILRGAAEPIRVAPANVRLVALKKAEREEALVVRLQEVGGRATRAILRLGTAGEIAIRLPRYGLRTLVLTREGQGIHAREVDLVEGL